MWRSPLENVAYELDLTSPACFVCIYIYIYKCINKSPLNDSFFKCSTPITLHELPAIFMQESIIFRTKFCCGLMSRYCIWLTYYFCPTQCAPFQWGWEYADCISSTEVRTLRTPLKKIGVLSITLNCIWWWGSNSGNVEKFENSLIVITPKSTLPWNVSTC